ncbi:hypothetical protein IU500_18540 [Nocardia terpenica]|uniref:hypothetical protein n=1 Tax=Nocardia terpenica TaxID=455432 RepID=UPI0018959400|nr:hypothetical protein [Nocardia terpenica]MBF6063485.1 hypothetical protein [Nocardia terpenica]MBF6106041.1 hypothetical protein [Nocardia terpenica]MBF6113374.1 hypothetical protein [Nocardia terpenica]MBF6119782.1 hypothetical protein [Nocardia terpenica]MBF6152193.1 hypothetical protein [Nocardia terpenica]
MSEQTDFVVLNPDGTVIYGSRDGDQRVWEAIRTHVPDLSTQGMGRVRAWFADDFSSPDLLPNPLADRVLTRLGYQHPTGWYGPVALSMEEDMVGEIAALDSEVCKMVDDLLATADGTATNHATARTAEIVDSTLLDDLNVASAADFGSAPTESALPTFPEPDTGAGL